MGGRKDGNIGRNQAFIKGFLDRPFKGLKKASLKSSEQNVICLERKIDVIYTHTQTVYLDKLQL